MRNLESRLARIEEAFHPPRSDLFGMADSELTDLERQLGITCPDCGVVRPDLPAGGWPPVGCRLVGPGLKLSYHITKNGYA